MNIKRQVENKIKYAAIILSAIVIVLTGVLQNREVEIWNTHIPIFAFLNQTEQEASSRKGLLGRALQQIPLNQYLLENMEFQVSVEDRETYELILKSEGRDEYEREEEAIVLREDTVIEEDSTIVKETPLTTIFTKMQEKAKTYDLANYAEFEDLVGEFYAIDKTTVIDASKLNVENLMSKDMKLTVGNEKPQILIYHTHSQETYADSVPGDKNMTVVGVGETLAAILREQYGYNVIHDTGEYDVIDRDNAYSVAAPAIEKILEENQSIEVVIDIHRDAISADRKLVTELNGRPTAQFMFFNGLSRTRDRGEISYLPNSYIDDNLSFAFQMQVKCNEYYPGVTRRIYLKGYRYNMHYRPKSLLIELGETHNTVEEAKNACDPIAHALHMVLSGEEP